GMPDYRVRFWFNMGGHGHREDWYLKGAADMAGAMTRAKDLARLRTNCLGLFNFLERISVQDLSKKNLSDHEGVWMETTSSGPLFARDTAWNCILIACRGLDSGVRQLNLRGCPDQWIRYAPTFGAEVASDPGYTAAFNALAGELTNPKPVVPGAWA